MRKTVLAVLLVGVLVALAGCSGGGGQASGGRPSTQEGVAKAFVDSLFAGKYDQAKALAHPTLAEDTKQAVDRFAKLAGEYQFQEATVASYRPWGYAGNPEQDRRAEVRFQYKAKAGADDWHIGYFELHVLHDQGNWGTGEIEYKLPAAE